MLGMMILDWLRHTANRSERHGRLHYGWPIRITMIIGVLFVLFFLGVAISNEEDLTVTSALAAFLALALAGVVETFCVVVEYDDNCIHTKSPWRANRMVDFNEVVQVEYSHFSQWYALNTENSGRIRIPMMLSGKDCFLSELESRGLNIPATKFR